MLHLNAFCPVVRPLFNPPSPLSPLSLGRLLECLVKATLYEGLELCRNLSDDRRSHSRVVFSLQVHITNLHPI